MMIALSWLISVCAYCATRPAGVGYASVVALLALALALLPVLAG